LSTRCTITYSDDFHLYEECFDSDNVYLALDGGDWSAALETSKIDWRDSERSKPALHLRVNIDLWRQIVEGWNKSNWANHPELDHRQIELSFDGLRSWLTSFPEEHEGDAKNER
jgi:hypothetical protein